MMEESPTNLVPQGAHWEVLQSLCLHQSISTEKGSLHECSSGDAEADGMPRFIFLMLGTQTPQIWLKVTLWNSISFDYCLSKWMGKVQ
jgi:hypothetical protein